MDQATHPAATGRRHPGIYYSTIPGFNSEMFRCDTWRATLSTPTCARRWTDAQSARGEEAEKLRLCVSCPIGASHAGQEFITRSGFYESNICPRCTNGSGRRLIGGLGCISCYNRQREWLKGKNAKGTAPSKMKPLFQVRLRYEIRGAHADRTLVIRRSPLVTGYPEAVIGVLRNTQGEIRFGFAPVARNLRQGRLF